VLSSEAYEEIDPSLPQDDLTYQVTVPDGECFVLGPDAFVLAATQEAIQLPPDIAARLEGKSSLGRLGLVVHSTAGFIDPGFLGTITLELSSIAGLPIKLWPGMKIGQLCLMQMTSPAQRPYGHIDNGSKYFGQTKPTASRSHLDF
jgi:dCTP deaminase